MAAAVVAAAAAPAATSVAASAASSPACCCVTSCASKLCCSSGPATKCCGINSANILYFVMWLASTFAAFLLYQFPPSPDSKIVSLSCPSDNNPGCQKTPYILRMTFASSLYFLAMSLATIGASMTSSFGHKLHDGFWVLKWVFYIALHVASVWMPSDALKNYSYIQSFGAAVFLLVQIVLLIDFCYDVAEWFRANGIKKNHAGEESVKPCWAFLMILVMVGCFAVIVTMAVLGFQWFTTPVATRYSTLGGKCGFNTFVLVFAIILFVLGLACQFAVTSRSGSGSVVTALFIGAYCMWNVFSGLLATHVCQSQVASNSYAEPVSIILTILSAAYAAFQFPKVTDGMMKSNKNAGKPESVWQKEDSSVNVPLPTAEPEDAPVPYSYSKFHVAFCFASCFVAMQLSSWLEFERATTATDTTTPQAWVKIASAWMCGMLYIWTILAPVLLPNRDFSKQKFVQSLHAGVDNSLQPV